MIEKLGSLWDFKDGTRVITTNGTVKANGACVMGRGIARQAKARYPGLDLLLGGKIKNLGNHVYPFFEFDIVAFPVKYHWKDSANLDLIRISCGELHNLWESRLLAKPIYVPRTGCGNGGLRWASVKPILYGLLPEDDFILISLPWEQDRNNYIRSQPIENKGLL